MAVPTRRRRVIFGVKVGLLRVRRGVLDRATGLPRHPCGSLEGARPLAEIRVPLVSDPAPEERRYELGKIQNVRVAAARLNGTCVPAGAVFSFWRQLGRCSQRRGFVVGRQIQEGCLVPSVGGGLCLLSNALYAAARRAGLEIVERHAHTRSVPGSLTERGEDATVAWNHIDLRFRHTRPWRLVVSLTGSELIVQIESTGGGRLLPIVGSPRATAPPINPSRHACGRCDRTECAQYGRPRIVTEEALTVALDLAPEFREECGKGEIWMLGDAPGLRFAAIQVRLAGRRAWKRDRTKASAEMARAEAWA